MTIGEVEESIGQTLECLYPDSKTGEMKRRVGRVTSIRRGPCYPIGGGRFAFRDAPWGEVYILWNELGGSTVKSFKWVRVQGLRKQNSVEFVPPPATPAAVPQPDGVILVRRMRPTLGGT